MTGNQIEIMAFHYGLELGKKVAVNEFGHSKATAPWSGNGN